MSDFSSDEAFLHPKQSLFNISINEAAADISLFPFSSCSLDKLFFNSSRTFERHKNGSSQDISFILTSNKIKPPQPTPVFSSSTSSGVWDFHNFNLLLIY